MRKAAILFALITTVAVGTPQALAAQAQAGTPSASAIPDSVIVTSLKRQLRNLVSAQESFYASRSAYSNSLKELGYVAREDAHIMVFRADKNGWVGRAVHPMRPGKSCVIWVGPDANAALAKTDATQLTGGEGEPVCDQE